MARQKSEQQIQREEEYRRIRGNLLAFIRNHQKELARTDIYVPDIPHRITDASVRNISNFYEKVKEYVDKWHRKVRLGEVLYNNILGMFGSPANIKQAEAYIERTFSQAEEIMGDMDEVYVNLANTNPEVVERAERLLYDSNALKEEVSTQAWANMVKYGEMLTVKEARQFSEIDDENQTDSEEYDDE